MALRLEMIFLLLSQQVWNDPQATEKCATINSVPITYKYYRPGDLIIAGISSQVYVASQDRNFDKHPLEDFVDEGGMLLQNYQQILSFAFAVQEINENAQLLPNISLGFDIFNSYFMAHWTYQASLQLLSTQGRLIPNYKCDTGNNVVAVIAGPNSHVCYYMAHILSPYKIPQLIYGSSALMENDPQGVFFLRVFPNENSQYMGIIQLLLHLKWTWIGVLYLDTVSGERFMQRVLPIFNERGICFDFVEQFPNEVSLTEADRGMRIWFDLGMRVMNITTNAVLIHGQNQMTTTLRMMPKVLEFEGIATKPKGKVYIMVAEMEFSSPSFLRDWPIDVFHGAISFAVPSNKVSGFHKFILKRNPILDTEDRFVKLFWQRTFACIFSDSSEDETGEEICTGEENLESLPTSVFDMSMTGHSYSMYNAVHAMAHAVKASTLKHISVARGRKWRTPFQQVSQLHYYLRSVSFNNSAGDTISFDQDGNLKDGFDIFSWVTFPNLSFLRVKVGEVDPLAPEEKQLSISLEKMTWPHMFNQTQPHSVCNEDCHAGYSRMTKEGEAFCCFICKQCPEGKISTLEDLNACVACQEDHYANENHDLCIPKTVTFLSYEELLGILLACFSVFLAFLSLLVLWIFIRHQETPIVKANNRRLTYTLLLCLLLSFLCPLLFIGQPNTVSCLFRQVAFGIIFSAAVACILAKTIIVVLAFLATNPDSRLRKWVGKRLGDFIVLFCTVAQAIICIIWLATSPPFPDLDMHSVTEEIVLECNEGSKTMFYCVLGFMGFLAVVTFTVAFPARKLPDSFNEAKFITFSMLVFCSVWVSFVPTYLSSKGKNMVAVEIFAMLASSAGLLGCIFSPKCFIIIIHPELNNKEKLIKRDY